MGMSTEIAKIAKNLGYNKGTPSTKVAAIRAIAEVTSGGGGGSGEIPDGSIGHEKLDWDDLLATLNTDDDFAAIAASSASALGVNIKVIAQTAIVRNVLETASGVRGDVLAPKDFRVGGMVGIDNIVLAWMSGSNIEVARPSYSIHTAGNDLVVTAYARGNTSTIHGVLGVDTAWTVTAADHIIPVS